MSRITELDRQNIWHPFDVSAMDPIPVVRGEGSLLFTEDNKSIIDAISSWWVNIHGHAHPAITKAITDQLSKLHHVLFAGFTHEPAVTLSEKLLSKLPRNQKKVFFSDNGSTAVEVALKLSIQYWKNKNIQKPVIVALENSYHGDTFGAMSSGARSHFVEPFTEYLFDVQHLPPLDTKPDAAIERFRALVATGNVGCIIFEPLVQGAGGMKIHSNDTLNQLMIIAKEANVLTIADEVMTGFGRTGKWFASNHLSQTPDLLCLSKGLTGGTLPLGITSCSEEIWNAFQERESSKTFLHGHSFTGNPIACAAANASFDLLDNEESWKNIGRISNHHDAFIALLQHHKAVKNPRKLGTICAFDVVSRDISGYLNPVRDSIMKYCLAHGVLIRPLGDVVYILTPYCISDKELLHVYDTVLGSLDTLK